MDLQLTKKKRSQQQLTHLILLLVAKIYISSL